MRILALSAANIRHRPRGTSVWLAETVLRQISELETSAETELIALVDKTINPCIGCGLCVRDHACRQFDDDFGPIYDSFLRADAVIVVTAHYAPIPAKLCALLERIESISFLGQFNDPDFHRPLVDKPYAIIGHAGMTPQCWQSYYDVIMKPIINAFGFPVSMTPVDTGVWPNVGVLVGPKEVSRDVSSPFPVQIYDEPAVAEQLRLVARAVVASVKR